MCESAVIVTKTIKHALLPLAAFNYGIDRAKAYLAERFAHDMEQKTKAIPAEHIVEPKSSVVGPAIQGLAFTHEEADLKSMYLSLLATAMDGRVSSIAHPAFVEIIRQIDAAEVGLLKLILTKDGFQPIVEIRHTEVDEKFQFVLQKHYFPLYDPAKKQDVEISGLTAMVDNWIRLGLVDVSYSQQMSDKRYSSIERREHFKTLKAELHKADKHLVFQKGTIQRTAFGLQFAQAVGMLDTENSDVAMAQS